MSTKLNKNTFNKKDFKKVYDIEFNQLSQPLDPSIFDINQANVEDFFNLYSLLFYDIPENGSNSHEFLIEESNNYINYDFITAETKALLEEIESLRDELIIINLEKIDSINSYNDLNTKLSDKETQIILLENQVRELEIQINTLRTLLEVSGLEINEALEEIARQLNIVKDELKQVKEERDNLFDENQTLKRKLDIYEELFGEESINNFPNTIVKSSLYETYNQNIEIDPTDGRINLTLPLYFENEIIKHSINSINKDEYKFSKTYDVNIRFRLKNINTSDDNFSLIIYKTPILGKKSIIQTYIINDKFIDPRDGAYKISYKHTFKKNELISWGINYDIKEISKPYIASISFDSDSYIELTI